MQVKRAKERRGQRSQVPIATYLAPSAGRSSRPAQPSTPDSSWLLGTDRKAAWDSVEILKSVFFFKLALRLCECSASTNARSAPQSPPPAGALLAAGLRKAHL